jgi:hypothetical protein
MLTRHLSASLILTGTVCHKTVQHSLLWQNDLNKLMTSYGASDSYNTIGLRLGSSLLLLRNSSLSKLQTDRYVVIIFTLSRWSLWCTSCMLWYCCERVVYYSANHFARRISMSFTILNRVTCTRQTHTCHCRILLSYTGGHQHKS